MVPEHVPYAYQALGDSIRQERFGWRRRGNFHDYHRNLQRPPPFRVKSSAILHITRTLPPSQHNARRTRQHHIYQDTATPDRGEKERENHQQDYYWRREDERRHPENRLPQSTCRTFHNGRNPRAQANLKIPNQKNMCKQQSMRGARRTSCPRQHKPRPFQPKNVMAEQGYSLDPTSYMLALRCHCNIETLGHCRHRRRLEKLRSM